MSTYVMSDLHGCYEAYRAMLEEIKFSDEDFLYILGDIIDRGRKPVKILLDIMSRPNVAVLAGNHELMAMSCLPSLLMAVTDSNIEKLDKDVMFNLMVWQQNGAEPTISEFRSCNEETRWDLMDFMEDMELYAEEEISGNSFLMVHAGLGNFSPQKSIEDYDIYDLLWERPDYDVPYFEDKYVITGHTPTMLIENNPRPGYIYKANRHIAIDCGCSFPGGRLGCLRLDDMKEFYVECSEK